jgi:reactive chlorine resistance protein C
MESLFALAQRSAGPLLRFSLGLVLLWIATLKFADPAPVRGLLAASLPFLASNAFVYAVGVLEITAAVLLFAGLWVRYVGLGVLVLFGGTLTIFLIAPMLTYGPHGFPLLSLLGQFLLKDTVLAAAAINLVALDSARQRTRHTQAGAATSRAMAS